MSDYMKNELIKGGVIESRIVVNPYFTEINNFNNGSQQSRINLLFIGRLINSKGPHYAIEAVKDILLQKENVFLEIIGDGEMKGFLEKKCKELGIVHKVKFHGWKDKKFIKDMLNRSYLVIFPSVYPEAFGIVGIEAMMAGKPVIAFNVGGVNMWLKDNFNGFLIQPKDVSTMKTKINNLIEDKILYQSFCLNAKREAISKFIPDIHINNLIIIYKDAIRKN
jgi:glycosyltransferase involved in cell wall biosynthesis